MITLTTLLFSAGIGIVSGFLYALLFLLQKHSSPMIARLFAPARIIILGLLWWYLLLWTRIPLILVVLFFLATFLIVVQYKAAQYGRS